MNPITIKLETASHVAEQFSWVPSPSCSPPGRPFPINLLLGTCVSSDNSFPSVRQEPSFGPWQGSPVLHHWCGAPQRAAPGLPHSVYSVNACRPSCGNHLWSMCGGRVKGGWWLRDTNRVKRVVWEGSPYLPPSNPGKFSQS